MQAAIVLDHDAIDGADPLGRGGEVVHQGHGFDLVRQGDVAPGQPQCGQAAHRRFDLFFHVSLNSSKHISEECTRAVPNMTKEK